MQLEKVRPLIINEAEVARAAPSRAEIIGIVEETYRLHGETGVEVPSKIGVHPDHKNSFLHAMPAWVAGQRALGMKWVSYFPGNLARGLPDSTGIIVLNDPEHGLPVAIMEGMWITHARTAACAAVMAKHLIGNSQPRVVGLIGCGGLGRWSLLMLSEVFPSIEEVIVSSRTNNSREAFCARMAKEGRWQLKPGESPKKAVETADIVVSAIPPPSAPFIEPGWLKPGMLALPLDYFHCYTPQAISSLSVLVTDEAERIRRLAAAPERPVDLPVLQDFAQLLAGKARLETTAAAPIMGLPTGVASTDMTVAWEIYRRARAAGLGTEVVLTD